MTVCEGGTSVLSQNKTTKIVEFYVGAGRKRWWGGGGGRWYGV